MIRVLLVDDHRIIRSGLGKLLENEAEIEIVGEADEGSKALNLIEDLNPDVAIVDISMPNMTGIELTKIISKKFVHTHVLILSTYIEEESIKESFEAGALGFLSKNSTTEEIVKALEKISQGKVYYNGEVLEILGSAVINSNSPIKSLKSLLTAREKEILRAIVNGATSKEISNDLFISIRTVDAHRRNLMQKLNVLNSADLVRVSIQKKLI